MRRLLVSVLALLALPVLSLTASAETDWPTKPIKIIVPWPPGGAADIAARYLQHPLQDVVKQSIVIENKSGAGGIVGTEALARSPADGYTIGMVISSHASNPSLYSKLPYDTVKDIKPITILVRSPNVIAVHPSAPYKTLADIIAAAKAAPGKLQYASSGNGTAQHLGLEQLKILTGIDMGHIPYRGAGPALNDLVNGQVQIGVLNSGGVFPHVQAGRLRAIAVTTAKRSPSAPDIPAVSETVPGFDFPEYFAFVAPAGVPDEMVQKIYEAIAKAAHTPFFVEKAKEVGLEPVLNTPAEFRTQIASEIKKFGDLVRTAKIRLD
jgi:tripartite-type tricarboxylate transporter receptor subunit TctC